MANEFLPKIKTFKEKYLELNEQELTDDDIIALLDKHLQREITEEGEPDGDSEKDDQRSKNDESAADDEIEQSSESLINKKMEELSNYIDNKKKEIDKIVKQIKRKEPPSGDISDEPLTNREKLKANWFEVDI